MPVKKHTYEYVKEFIEKENYQLLSTEYINSHNKLKIKCEKNHIFEMRFYSFKNGQRCPICFGTPKLTYDYVKECIEKENYTLISTDYKGNKSKLKIQCDKGHEYEVKFNSFQQGRRCPICFGTPKHSYEYIKNFFKDEGYELISTDYKDNKQKLKTKCPIGHDYLVSFHSFQGKDRCFECNGTPRHQYDYVKNYMGSFNYTLLSNEYKSVYQKLKIRCDKGHEYEVVFNNFKNNSSRCPVCDILKTTSKGEKEVLEYVKSIYSGIIIENDRTKILNPLTNRYLELDIYLPEIKFAIEYNGDYHHSIPYQIQKDLIKVNQCKELNIDLLVINDSEWRNNKNQCKELIYKRIFLNP